MKPYYSQNNITLYHADCREIMHSLNGKTVISDPPYNVGYHYEGYADKLSHEDYYEMLRVTLRCPSIVLHYPESLFELSWILEEIPHKVVSWVYNANTPRQWRAIAWFGTVAPDFTRGGQPYKNAQDRRIQKLIAQGKSARLYDWWNIQQVKNVSDEKLGHPCQIPFEVMRRILEITPVDCVVDPFAGSGTTLVAAQAMGKSAVGIEMNESYCELIANRLEKSASIEQLNLLDSLCDDCVTG